MMLINNAYAAGAPAGGGIVSFVPLLLMLAVLYFLLYLPQRKRMKSHQQMLSKLKHGDKVLTNSGIYGSVKGLTDKVVTLEISEDVRIKVSRPQIAGLAAE